MKSERRHELATNELADWIQHFPQWCSKNRSTVIIAVIFVVALIAYTFFYYNRQGTVVDAQQAQIGAMLERVGNTKQFVLSGQIKGQNISTNFFNLAGTLESAAGTADNANLVALAMIKRAEALRAELQFRSEPAEADVVVSQTAQARDIYTAAAEKAESATIVAMAKYGNAMCLEDLSMFNEAAAIYADIAADEKFKGTSYDIKAANRLAILPEMQKKVTFLQSPEKIPTPVMDVPEINIAQ